MYNQERIINKMIEDRNKSLLWMDRRLEELKKLQKTDPERAKKVALKNLKDAGILNELGELNEPYNEIFEKTN